MKLLKFIKKNTEIHLEYFRDLLTNKAYFYTEKGVNKAKALNKNPRKDTESQIENYNVLGNYISNISKLENYAKKKNRTRNYPFQQPTSTSQQT